MLKPRFETKLFNDIVNHWLYLTYSETSYDLENNVDFDNKMNLTIIRQSPDATSIALCDFKQAILDCVPNEYHKKITRSLNQPYNIPEHYLINGYYLADGLYQALRNISREVSAKRFEDYLDFFRTDEYRAINTFINQYYPLSELNSSTEDLKKRVHRFYAMGVNHLPDAYVTPFL